MTPLLTWSAGRRRRLRQRRHVRLNPERTAVPRRLQRRHNGLQNLPAADPVPPGGDQKGTAGAAIMIVPAKMTVPLTASPRAPRGGMLSNGRRGVPPAARPPPLEGTTAPPPGEMSAPAVTRPTLPPREGAMSGVTKLTGADVGPQAQMPPSVCDMMRQTRGGDRNGSLGRLPMPVPGETPVQTPTRA